MQIPNTQHSYGVAKFGGTSVADYAAMLRCAKIMAKHPSIRVIVVSAPSGITNLLVKLSQAKHHPIDTAAVLHDIQQKIHAILQALPEHMSPTLRDETLHLLQHIESLSRALRADHRLDLVDELLSCGERISAQLFTAVLTEQGFPAIYQDARTLIKTNDYFGKAEVQLTDTHQQVTQLLLPLLANHIIVTEGFIGSTLDHITTTLGRGGSDYSAALLAEAMDASLLQIWTDVAGIYTVDPRLIPAAQSIETLCFTEAAELATFGAKVLHPATLWPAIRKNIPVFIGSSLQPDLPGTWVQANDTMRQAEMPLLRAIALRRQQVLLTVHSLEMLQAHGFLANVFAILARHQLSVDLITTSEVNIALTFDNAALLTEAVLTELRAIGNISLSIDKNLCLIALIGNDLHRSSGLSGRVFNLLRSFNIRLICHGASHHNLCFLVDEPDALAVVQALHVEFFEI